MDIYGHICLMDMAFKTALIESGPRPCTLNCSKPWGDIPSDSDTDSSAQPTAAIGDARCLPVPRGSHLN